MDQTVVGNCAADNIRIVIPLGPATCNGSGGDACAISNTANETAHWPYTPKTGAAGIYPPTSFFEGGININAVFGENKCFASFAATTGASTSFNSTAKDFALGDFDVCSVAATKTCSNDDEGDDAIGSIVYNVRGCGINDGSGTINLTTLENSIGGGASYTPGDLEWYVPGQVDDGAGGLRDFDPATDCDDGTVLDEAIANGSLVTDLSAEDLSAGEALVYEFSESTVNGAEDTVTLDAAGTDGAPIDADTATATCPLRTFSASMSVTKQCAADLEDAGSNLVVVIVVAGQVCNTGEVQLTGLSLTDEVADGTVTLAADDTTLDPGECTDYDGYYYPSTLPNGDICPFMDMVTATATAPTNTATGGETGCTVVAGPAIECSADSNSATCDLRAGSGDNDCSTGALDPTP
jgi:hypothetical protein